VQNDCYSYIGGNKAEEKEQEYVYLSKEQVAVSIARLGNLHAFFGTVFLAFKQIHLPIGDPQPVSFKRVIGAMLQKYYLYSPLDTFSGDRRVYTPFLTSNMRDRWNKEQRFVDSLRRATDIFTDAFRLVRTPGKNGRAWHPDYIQKLLGHLSRSGFIPTFDLAVWLFREREWSEGIYPGNLIDVFLEEFFITPDEKNYLISTSLNWLLHGSPKTR
jgi:hypothetical protein